MKPWGEEQKSRHREIHRESPHAGEGEGIKEWKIRMTLREWQ